MRARLLAASALLAACGTTQSVRPLGAGQGALDLSIGGPTVKSPLFPSPILLAGYRRGLDDRSDAFGRLHVIPAVFGLAGVEAGASRLVLDERGPMPAVSMSAQGLFLGGPGGWIALPAASLNASWSTGPWVLYAGSLQAVSWGRRLEGRGAAFHWAPYAGATREVGRWTLGAELRWWEPHVGDDVLVWWQGMGGRGALAPMFSISRRLGADR